MSTPQYSAGELGFPLPPAPSPGDMPPGDGRYAIPSFLSFPSLVTNASRSFLASSDEAMRDSITNARAMRRDTVLFSALRARQRPTSQLSWHLDPVDDTDPAEVEAAAINTKVLENIPRFQSMLLMLLEAVWYGKFAVQLAWQWKDDIIPGKTLLGVRSFIPFNGDKIRFKWSGEPGFLVYGAFPGTWEATDWGPAHFLSPFEREQFIIHQFEPDDADWFDPQMAGMVHGVGLRGRLYWFWWLKQQVFALLMNYLERFSNGLTIFYYAAHDQQAELAATKAAQQQFSQAALIYPSWNKDGKQINGVERLEVGTASPALLQNLCTSYFDMVMVRAIRGESPYVGPEGAARGGGDMAELASEGLDETIKYDAQGLQQTVQEDFIKILYKYNTPGVRPGKFTFAVDSPNAVELMKYADQMYEWGMDLDGDDIYNISKLKKPAPGGSIVSKLQGMNAAAMSMPPEGMPVSGQAGPEMAQPQQGLQQTAPPEMSMAMSRKRQLPRRRLHRVSP